MTIVTGEKFLIAAIAVKSAERQRENHVEECMDWVVNVRRIRDFIVSFPAAWTMMEMLLALASR